MAARAYWQGQISLRGDKATSSVIDEVAKSPPAAQSAITITHPDRLIFDDSAVAGRGL